MIATATLLGRGIYSPSEAAMYARVRPQTLNRWLFGNSQGDPAIISEVRNDEKVVTFLDFVQLLAVRDIRFKHKVPLPKIRQAVELARSRGITYPFAVQHKTFLFGDMKDDGHGEVIIEIEGNLIQASGHERGNLVMREVAELYMRDLYFDPKTNLASKYHPFGESLKRAVVMDPKVRFGEPMIESCGYSAEALFDAYTIEGGIEHAAKAYGVEPSEIETAIRYFDLLGVSV
ncbi:hypothetical protein NA78x_005643 [Anatilimnocola sp. NA78]|uniref:hypothetical protein n=1 Tax=Anatilimnocola sp. NA78 TaxID=3415683 RepID=UPI003CE53D0D